MVFIPSLIILHLRRPGGVTHSAACGQIRPDTLAPMRRGVVIVLVAAVLETGAASQQAGVDRAQLMRDVSTLSDPSFEGRAGGSPGGMRARRWLVEQFGVARIPPLAETGYEQPFTADGRAAANIVG